MAKLIRDLIPDDMRAHGYEPELRTVEGEEKLQALFDKLREETEEVIASRGDISESGDVLEVLTEIHLEVYGKAFPWLGRDVARRLIAEQAIVKGVKRGGFRMGYLWVNSDDFGPDARSAREAYQKAEEKP